MAGRAPCPTSIEANCVKIFKKNQVRRLSRLLLSKNRVSIASLSLKSQLRQSNCYLQVSTSALDSIGPTTSGVELQYGRCVSAS